MTDLEKAKAIAENMTEAISDAGTGFIANFESIELAEAYMSAISKLKVASARTETTVTVTNRQA